MSCVLPLQCGSVIATTAVGGSSISDNQIRRIVYALGTDRNDVDVRLGTRDGDFR